mmetsp:Transcript_111900/g.198188  ORF Transcript_111900/g.198188 Transcript_111900/m.198188 type:complete len:245 (-) Transcript_111900:47-781(-)
MFDFDEIEEEVSAGTFGQKKDEKKEEPAKKPPPADDDLDDIFGGSTRDDPKPKPADDDDMDDIFGGCTTDKAPGETAPTKTTPAGGKVTITITFRYQWQRWSRDYAIDAGTTVLDLKKKVAEDETGWFQLLSSSTPLSDSEVLSEDTRLDFFYAPPTEDVAEDGAELELAIAVGAAFGFKTMLKAKSGCTVQELKELMAKQDSTGGTKPGDFELIVSCAGRILGADEKITAKTTQLMLVPSMGA